MKPADLPTHFDLITRRPRPHGTRLRYMSGCKCVPCRAANSRYESSRIAARASGDWNGMVPPDRAIAHLRELSRQGVGYKSVAKAAGISKTCIAECLFGRKEHIRARTERKILAVTRAAMPQSGVLPANSFWKLINDLRRRFGYSKRAIARMLLGPSANALQLNPHYITLKNAVKVMRLHEELTNPRPKIVAVTRGEYCRSSLGQVTH